MNIAIYGDVHLTKKMGPLQSEWDQSAIKVFTSMYDEFRMKNVDAAVCLGDFFDAPRLEAKSVKLVTEILSIMNNNDFITWILLGNHEIFDEESNILEILDEYKNIKPVTSVEGASGYMFIPYNVNIKEEIFAEELQDKYLFTHHDFYGVQLAGGKVKSSFGLDPAVVEGATRVFNGHIHLHSYLGNIINVGSLLKSQQGELRIGEYPTIYYLNPETGGLEESYIMESFIAPLTVNPQEIDMVLNMYNESVKLILRIPYDEESDISELSKYEHHPRILKLQAKMVLKNALDTEDIYKKTAIDMKELISSYIKKDSTIAAEDKDRVISIGLDLLEG